MWTPTLLAEAIRQFGPDVTQQAIMLTLRAAPEAPAHYFRKVAALLAASGYHDGQMAHGDKRRREHLDNAIAEARYTWFCDPLQIALARDAIRRAPTDAVHLVWAEGYQPNVRSDDPFCRHGHAWAIYGTWRWRGKTWQRSCRECARQAAQRRRRSRL